MRFDKTKLQERTRTATPVPYRGTYDPSETESNFKEDKRFEEESTRFLIRSHILMELGTKTIIEDIERQKQGVDLICDIPFDDGTVKESQNVDIKAIASTIPTFCFEVAGNTGSGQVGWLLNSELVTDYYLVVYHDIIGGTNYSANKEILTVDNVNYTKALLINKEKLQQLVLDYFMFDSLKDAQEVVKRIKFLNQDETKMTTYSYDGVRITQLNNASDKKDLKMWFSASNHLKERPINVVIRQQLLESLSDKIFVLDENGRALCPKRSLQEEYEAEKILYEIGKQSDKKFAA